MDQHEFCIGHEFESEGRMETQPTLTFHDALGRTLARGTIPADVLIEGEHKSVKEFAVTAEVAVAGKLDHFLTTSAKGETITGAIVKRPDAGPSCFALDRLDVQPGEQIKGSLQALTLKGN